MTSFRIHPGFMQIGEELTEVWGILRKCPKWENFRSRPRILGAAGSMLMHFFVAYLVRRPRCTRESGMGYEWRSVMGKGTAPMQGRASFYIFAVYILNLNRVEQIASTKGGGDPTPDSTPKFGYPYPSPAICWYMSSCRAGNASRTAFLPSPAMVQGNGAALGRRLVLVTAPFQKVSKAEKSVAGYTARVPSHFVENVVGPADHAADALADARDGDCGAVLGGSQAVISLEFQTNRAGVKCRMSQADNEERVGVRATGAAI
ncbi:hypothetical protein B0H11DRAFT_1906478 [Mycena galericulata]|nr:hypothetical protein B0H11DRAFT_1906478 [Mycena galericulata]